MQMHVIFLCPFMDGSALPFIRATNFTWEETDLKRQAPWSFVANFLNPRQVSW